MLSYTIVRVQSYVSKINTGTNTSAYFDESLKLCVITLSCDFQQCSGLPYFHCVSFIDQANAIHLMLYLFNCKFDFLHIFPGAELLKNCLKRYFSIIRSSHLEFDNILYEIGLTLEKYKNMSRSY